jgi:hypothetical protein
MHGSGSGSGNSCSLERLVLLVAQPLAGVDGKPGMAGADAALSVLALS